jgi:hypothetical protein
VRNPLVVRGKLLSPADAAVVGVHQSNCLRILRQFGKPLSRDARFERICSGNVVCAPKLRPPHEFLTSLGVSVSVPSPSLDTAIRISKLLLCSPHVQELHSVDPRACTCYLQSCFSVAVQVNACHTASLSVGNVVRAFTSRNLKYPVAVDDATRDDLVEEHTCVMPLVKDI